MNTRRNVGWGRGEVAVGDNQVPPQALAAEMQMSANPTGLADGEVKIDFVHKALATNLQA